MGVVVRRYIDFLILLSLLLLYLFIFAAASLLFVHKKFFFSFFYMIGYEKMDHFTQNLDFVSAALC